MGWQRIAAAVVGIALLALAGTALFSTAAAGGISCGSVVSPRLASIQQSVDFAHFVAAQTHEPPEQLARAGEQALHDCRAGLTDRRITTVAAGAVGVALLLGPFAVGAVRGRRPGDGRA